MGIWRRQRPRTEPTGPTDEIIRSKFKSFQSLQALNNESLELLARLQEDLQCVPPLRSHVGARIDAIFQKAESAVSELNHLCEGRYARLDDILRTQRHEVEAHIAAREELAASRLAARLSEIGPDDAEEVGGKAGVLGEIRNVLRLPVPDGFVLTTEAYSRFCGIPLWEIVRDETRGLELDDLEGQERCAARLTGAVLGRTVPRAVEVAIGDRALAIETDGMGWAVRSSAVGEGGRSSFAGQFESLLNVPRNGLVDAYKKVVASRFSARALFYRLSRGVQEVESPMAVLFLPTLDARASGIMYSRDPKNPKGGAVMITATMGLGTEIASGRSPADQFLVSRSGAHKVLDRQLASKESAVVPEPTGGLGRQALDGDLRDAPSLPEEALRTLAVWALKLEAHFKSPQDVEWVLDKDGRPWVVQSRPLTLADTGRDRGRPHTRAHPVLSGGRTVYPGRTSGNAFIVSDSRLLTRTPRGAVVFVERPTPELVKVLPRLAGLVSSKGNVAGHGAALLREFKVPSIFEAPDFHGAVRPGDPVSLDAVRSKVYEGIQWPPRTEKREKKTGAGRETDPISRRVLALHLLDPDDFNFRPGGCKSVHDVLRFAHERAIESMFALNDEELERGNPGCRRIVTTSPMNLYVLDLGGGLVQPAAGGGDIQPEDVRSRPFRAFWEGVSRPDVAWNRKAAPSLGGFASVLASSLSEQHSGKRALGDYSYLLVAEEYMNLNARMAYHFSMVDASLSETPNNNYVTFRFAGGGASRRRRSLRACFIQSVLGHFGFHVDRRGDVVNAWFKKATAGETAEKLDILGRLTVCTTQLDMYMSSQGAMKWYADQFIAGNYDFEPPEGGVPGDGPQG